MDWYNSFSVKSQNKFTLALDRDFFFFFQCYCHTRNIVGFQ